MKKIIGAALLGTMAAGVFADVSFQANARFRGDIFSYQSPQNGTTYKLEDGNVKEDVKGRIKDTNGEGTDDNGTFKIADLTSVSDDVKLNASTDNAGMQLVFTVTTPYTPINNPDNITMTSTDAPAAKKNYSNFVTKSYQLWLNFGKLRLDAGSYDKRLSKNISTYDGKWNTNLGTPNKPGIFVPFDSQNWGQDAGNIAVIMNKRVNNVMATYAVNDKLNVHGLVYFGSNAGKVTGNAADGTDVSNTWKMAPFAIGAQYKPDKNTQIAVVGKMQMLKPSSATQGEQSVWTLHGDYYSKLNNNLEIEAAYTFGASIYTNNGNFRNAKGNDYVQVKGVKAQDSDVFAHGFDFRVQDKLTSQLTLLGVVGVNYVHSSEAQRRANRHKVASATKLIDGTKVAENDDTSDIYKDARARSYGTGAAGVLAYQINLTADYAMTDTINLLFQTQLKNTNLFDVSYGDSSKASVDYWKNTGLVLRPAAQFTASKNCFLQTGLEVTFNGFRDHATGSRNVFNTKIALPLVLNVSI